MNELIKSAKNRGFHPRTVTTGFMCKRDMSKPSSLINDNCIAVLLAEMQKWLRDEYNTHIEVYPVWTSLGGIGAGDVSLDCFMLIVQPDGGCYNFDGEYETYEQALEAGIKEALTLI